MTDNVENLHLKMSSQPVTLVATSIFPAPVYVVSSHANLKRMINEAAVRNERMISVYRMSLNRENMQMESSLMTFPWEFIMYMGEQSTATDAFNQMVENAQRFASRKHEHEQLTPPEGIEHDDDIPPDPFPGM